MFSSVRRFLGRHKRKLLAGTIVIGGVVFLTRYTQRKIREFQEKNVKEFLEQTMRQQYFEDTEKTCNQMIQSVAPNLRETVANCLDTESVVEKLRSKCGDKVASWNELKVLAISRSAVIIYSHVMLVTLIKVQFNLMGAYMYKDSQISKSAMKQNGMTQTKYMSLCKYFIYDGVKKLCTIIQEKVQEITASISLKNELTLRDLEQIYWAIVSSVSADDAKDPIKNLTRFMLPQNYGLEEGPVLSKLINETLDLLESEEVQNLVQSRIRAGFVLLIDHIAEYFTSSSKTEKVRNVQNVQNCISLPGTSNRNDTPWTDTVEVQLNHNSDQFIDVNKVTMPMAKIIPIINGQVPHKPISRDIPSKWLQYLVSNDELRKLGANVYEAFIF